MPSVSSVVQGFEANSSVSSAQRVVSKFADVTDNSQTRIGRWAWSSDAFDFDHDTHPDLYITNGMVSAPNRDSEDLNSFFWRQVVAKSPDEARPSHDYEQGWAAVNELIREHQADALVLDCTSFDMSEALFDAVRHSSDHVEFPVAIISDTPELADASLRARKAQKVLLIPKPFTGSQVATALSQLLG